MFLNSEESVLGEPRSTELPAGNTLTGSLSVNTWYAPLEYLAYWLATLKRFPSPVFVY